MPASSTMPAPYGRVMSGRGFAPNGFEAYDLPAAGQYNRDLPDLGAKASTDAWLQQAKMTKNLQGMHKRTNPNHIPSVMQGMRGYSGAEDTDLQQAAKRPRLMLPDYGRSASEPLLSFLRQKAQAMNLAVESLQLAAEAAKPTAAQLPKTLRSFQSGPARVVDGKPSPNYRIYSNAFQGGWGTGQGAPPNYSQAKVASTSVAPMKAATAPSQPAKNDPTPHPAFLKQPLPTRRPDQDTTPLLPQQGSSQQPQGVLPRPEQAPAAESWRETAPQAGEKLHTETASKLQHLLSGGPGVHSPSPSPTPTHQQDSRPSPHPTSSPKHSASHTTLSGEDTEVEEVSCGSHAAAAAQGLSPRAAGTSPEAEAQGRSQGPTRGEGPSGGYPAASSASPAAESRDSASPSASPRDGREGDRKRKSLDSRGSKDSSRQPFSVRTDVSSSKSHSAHKATLRPWGNLSSALQPVATPGGAQDPYPHPQLMPDALKKQNGKRQETDDNMQQLLQELAHAQGRAHAQHGAGVQQFDPQEHSLAGHANPPRAPLPAQLQCPAAVMQNSFNRLSHLQGSRPEAEQAGYPQAHPSSLPPSGPSPRGQEHHRGFAAPSHEFPAKFHQQQSAPISLATLSSLPPSVAAFYESEQRQQQHQQRQMTGKGSVLNHHLNGLKYNHRQQMARQHALGSAPDSKAHYNEGPVTGFAHSSHPMGGKGGYPGGSDSGFRVPSRVVTSMEAGGVRNPALLNRPAMSSHRDPQSGDPPMHQGYLRGSGSRQQASTQALEQYSQDLAVHAAQHAQHDAARGTRGSYFSGALSQQDPRQSSLHALGDMLGKSNLSPMDMAQLCSYASSGYAGNLNQLITQLQLVNELAHAQHDPAQPVVETTHRVVIPAAHLKEGSHAVARQAAAPLANMRIQSSSRPVGLDGGNRVDQSQQGRAVETPAPKETQSALDVVADAAAEAAADDEPSELLMLAAETLAGLNNMQPRSAAADPRPSHPTLDPPGNDSPAAARKLSRQLGDANRKQKRKQAYGPKAAAAANVTTAAAVHADGGGASVHPILGFSVPHSRRSYHRDSVPLPARNRLTASAGEVTETRSGSGDLKGSTAGASGGKQTKTGAAAGTPFFPTRSDVASDSSLTVSAGSSQGGHAKSGGK